MTKLKKLGNFRKFTIKRPSSTELIFLYFLFHLIAYDDGYSNKRKHFSYLNRFGTKIRNRRYDYSFPAGPSDSISFQDSLKEIWSSPWVESISSATCCSAPSRSYFWSAEWALPLANISVWGPLISSWPVHWIWNHSLSSEEQLVSMKSSLKQGVRAGWRR